jgi:hypothetical protein
MVTHFNPTPRKIYHPDENKDRDVVEASPSSINTKEKLFLFLVTILAQHGHSYVNPNSGQQLNGNCSSVYKDKKHLMPILWHLTACHSIIHKHILVSNLCLEN